MTTGWLVLAVGAGRRHGGNDGYDDEPSQHYDWDSTVPNHAKMAVGDVIAVWDTKALLGVSVIDDITVTQTEKYAYSCPQCQRASFKRRKTRSPVCLCDCGAEFDEPIANSKTVTAYRSQHANAWVDAAGALSAATLRSLCDSQHSQLSLRPFQWEKFREALEAAGEAAPAWIVEKTRLSIAGGHQMAIVRVRIGQAAFRSKLLAEQGEHCAFTGPAPAAALEAAHLYSYAATGEHHEDGGLLLRRDLHRLFDLGYITVHPEQLVLDVTKPLRNYALYGDLHGAKVATQLTKGQRGWLIKHWRLHRPRADDTNE